MSKPTTATVTVERRIYFYLVTAMDTRKLTVPFNPIPALQRIRSLPFEVESTPNRYFNDVDGDSISCWIAGGRKYPSIVLARIRRRDLPHMELNGQLTSLNIPLAGGLAEPIHAMFIRNDNAGVTFIGSEFNFHGPRASRIADYFMDKAKGVVRPFALVGLTDQNTSRQLRRLQDVRLFRLRISPSALELVNDVDPAIGTVFKQMLGSDSSQEEVEIMIKGQGRHSISRQMQERVKRLIVPELYDKASPTQALKLEVGGTNRETNRLDVVDLLSEKLISKKQIKLANSRDRILDKGATFDAIEEAYEELKDQLVDAAGLELL